MPAIEKMASGNLCLVISEEVSWESFPELASKFVEQHGAIVLKRVDTAVERMWIVLIQWRPFFLCYEDFPERMTLDSMNRFCNPVVEEIYRSMLS